MLAVYKQQPLHCDQLAPGHYLIELQERVNRPIRHDAHGNTGEQVHIFSGEELMPGIEQFATKCAVIVFIMISGHYLVTQTLRNI